LKSRSGKAGCANNKRDTLFMFGTRIEERRVGDAHGEKGLCLRSYVASTREGKEESEGRTG